MMPSLLASVPPEVNTTPSGRTPKAASMDARAAESSRAAHCPAACTLEGLAPRASQIRSISARASERSGAVTASR